MNWSLFDWLCIVFEIKARLKKSILIQDVLFKSTDAYEAEAILREMCIPVKEGEESEEEDTHKLPPYLGEVLFKKRLLFQALPESVRNSIDKPKAIEC